MSKIDVNLPHPGLSGSPTVPVPADGSLFLNDQPEPLAAPVTEGVSFRLMRFSLGLVLTGLGVATIVAVGLNSISVQQVGSEVALPAIALVVLSGIMLLGGGFGLMATSASGLSPEAFPSMFAAESIENQDGGHAARDGHESGTPVC